MTAPTTEELLRRIEVLEARERKRSMRRGARAALSVVALAALLAVPVGVFGFHSFTDVSDSNTFHREIGRVKGAGITTGCTATKYCPNDHVTRGQMAAFLARTGGRAAQDHINAATPAGKSGLVIGSVTVMPGDVPGGTANIKIEASMQAWVDPIASGCPCWLSYRLWVNGVATGFLYTVGIDTSETGTFRHGSTSLVRLVAVPTGVTARIELRASNIIGSSAVTTIGDLVATYIPFAGDGRNAVISASEASEPEPPLGP